MNGYQITFFTQQNRTHHHKSLAEWLMLAVRELGLRGATIVSASEGFGEHRRIHSAHFFELADQPQEIIVAASEEETDHLFAFLKKEGVHLFYVMTPVEYGTLGAADR